MDRDLGYTRNGGWSALNTLKRTTTFKMYPTQMVMLSTLWIHCKFDVHLVCPGGIKATIMKD